MCRDSLSTRKRGELSPSLSSQSLSYVVIGSHKLLRQNRTKRSHVPPTPLCCLYFDRRIFFQEQEKQQKFGRFLQFLFAETESPFWPPLYRFPNSRKRTLFPPIQKRKPQYSYRKSSFSGEKKNTLCCAVRPPEQAMAFDKCQPAKLLFMYPLILQFDTTTTHQQQKTQTNKPRTNINTSPQQHSNNRQLPTAVATVESTASTHSSSKTYQKPKASQHLLPEPRLILITHRKEE